MKSQIAHEWQVGEFLIQLVIQDWFALDGGVLWSGVPQEKWIEWCTPPFGLDAKNRVRLSINCFLITCPDDTRILADVSIGSVNRWKPANRDQFLMENGFNLFTEGLEPPDYVVPTHLHFDHAGGCVKLEGKKLVPAFQEAAFVLHEDEISHALQAHPKTRSSYLRETIQGIQILLEQNKVFLMRTDELAIERGITLIRTRGHTPGHLSVKIESEGQVALIPGALFPTRYHAIIACGVGNDTHSLEGADHKRRFLKEAFEGHWLVFLEHDPDIAFYVEGDAEKESYQLVPASH
jgi:glyoxylase-like metal-dependent hydrolase (beta-lactamase superfamily II)